MQKQQYEGACTRTCTRTRTHMHTRTKADDTHAAESQHREHEAAVKARDVACDFCAGVRGELHVAE